MLVLFAIILMKNYENNRKVDMMDQMGRPLSVMGKKGRIKAGRVCPDTQTN